METFRSTTVLLVRRDGKVCMVSDGQITMGQSTIIKNGAKKVRRTGKGQVLVGFAGAAADALALFARLEDKLDEHSGNLERAVVELAKDWRMDRALRQLQAMLIVSDKERSYLLSGTGELIQPDEEESILAVGSGSNFALAAARALLRNTPMSAAEIAREAMRIAAEICIFTNDRLTIEEL